MLNHITIMGRLTRDPELRYTQSGTPVASFTVAVDRDYTGQDGGRETDFIDCVSWRQGAEFVDKYFHKGSMIVVDGRLQSRKWQDRDGNSRTSWEILADHTYFGESKRRDESQSGDYSSFDNYNPPPRASQPSQPAARHSGGYDAGHTAGGSYHQSTFQELDDDDGELPF